MFTDNKQPNKIPILPPVDPDTLLLVMGIGAFLGGLGTGIYFISMKIGRTLGKDLHVLPDFPPFFKQE